MDASIGDRQGADLQAIERQRNGSGLTPTRRSAALLGLTALLLQSPALTSQTGGYTFLTVSSVPAWEPAINDAGEIVYVSKDPKGFLNLFSTIRGQLTHSTTNHVRSPAINDAGEVVYVDSTPGSRRFQIISTVRGSLSATHQANMPAINDEGEVCYVQSSSLPLEVRSDRRGRIATLRVTAVSKCDINRSGEIVYRDLDSTGQYQVFSTVRGQVTNRQDSRLRSPVINDSGEVAFVDSGIVYLLDDRVVASFDRPIGVPIDMNDHGDLVFPLRERGEFRIILATKSPQRYPDYPVLESVLTQPPELAAMIVVEPTAASRWIDPGRAGLLPVAILTTFQESGEPVDFDAADVDPLSVRLGPDAATIVVRSMSELEDVDRDGDLDLMLFFQAQKIGIKCDTTEVALHGSTVDGRTFSGSASISTPECP